VPALSVEPDHLRFGDRLTVSFHRTPRVPEDGRTHPLPAGLGRLPIVALRLGGRPCLALPMQPGEAMWIGFSGAAWKPNAVKVVVGGINAVTGEPEQAAHSLGEAQDYLVCPLQPWLDGFNAGGGRIRQFVAMPLGEGYGVEAGHGMAEQGTLAITAFEPRPGRFPDAPPPAPPGPVRFSAPRAVEAMAISAGGTIGQKLYPDPHGRDAWDLASAVGIELLLLEAGQVAALSGQAAPPGPVDAASPAAAGLPWFALDDGPEATLDPRGGPPPRTRADRDRELGRPPDAPGPAPGPPVTLRRRPGGPARGGDG